MNVSLLFLWRSLVKSDISLSDFDYEGSRSQEGGV